MFSITDGKGFHITFANGWTVSVQFGWGNYCDNYNYRNFGRDIPLPPSSTAEIAAWDKDNIWYDFGNGGDTDVKGHVTPDELLAFMNMIASL